MHRLARLSATVAAAGLLLAAGALRVATAVPDDHASATRIATFFSRLHDQPDNYARLRYASLRRALAGPALRQVVDQILVTELAMFGRIGDAEAGFQVAERTAPSAVPLPTAATWKTVPAADYVAGAVEGRRIVIVNEAHHRPQTRLLTLALLPRLRALGFDQLAIEGLDPSDTGLAARGYPVEASGFYIGEPLYGDIVREALRLGFKVHAYEPPDAGTITPQDRETRQAQALQAILEHSPGSRLFVHAGYAHADKGIGRLPDGARPMAAELRRLTGIEPYTVDQTMLGSGNLWDTASPYRHMVDAFPVQVASVLVPRAGGPAWSFRPDYHDATVLLPPPVGGDLRPAWLSRQGMRKPFRIRSQECAGNFPCLFEAFHASEGDDAIPADQFLLMSAGDSRWPLYLAPGKYRLRVRDAEGNVLSVRPIEVTDAQGLQEPSAPANIPPQPEVSSG